MSLAAESITAFCSKVGHGFYDNYLTFLLNARPYIDMPDDEMENLMPWSENARTNCTPVFTY
jgi:hypothetical protein